MKRWIAPLGGFALLAGVCGPSAQFANAQTRSAPPPFASRLTLQGSGENSALVVHRSPLGKPCLVMEAASRAHAVSPDVYDNIVSILNQCSKTISVKLCYYNTESCIDVEVSGQQRKDAILGVRPHMQYFRYSFREKM